LLSLCCWKSVRVKHAVHDFLLRFRSMRSSSSFFL
jgi:hypothetical protein